MESFGRSFDECDCKTPSHKDMQLTQLRAADDAQAVRTNETESLC